MLFSTLILSVFAAVILERAFRLQQNYLNARKTGLPIIFAPFDPVGVFIQITRGLTRPFTANLPMWMTAWASSLDPGWSWVCDDRLHKKLGQSYIVVSPGRNQLVTADPEALKTILKDRVAFTKPDHYKVLNIFGKNVDSINGDDWARHRKLTAPCFNERVSGSVWDEGFRQAQSMLHHWLNSNKGKVQTLVEDTRVVALHVLTSAGFGVRQEFLEGARKLTPGHSMTHRDSLMMILNNNVLAFVFPWNLKFLLPLMPDKVQKLGEAMENYRQYSDELITKEREILAKDQGSKANLISTLIRTSDQAQKESGMSSSLRLSDDEIKGNIFIFNVAGHDTTANSMAYTFALLALNPEIYEWVVEEIDEVIGGVDNPEYEKCHSRLKRTLALMYETGRLYPAVPIMPRTVPQPNTILTLSRTQDLTEQQVIIPPRTDISCALHACHVNPGIYSDPLTWNPKRWIHINPSTGAEELVTPPTGFQVWSGGPRICPGMKFAQVEFTSVVSTVLKKVRVFPTLPGAEAGKVLEGQEMERAKKELLEVVRDSDLVGITLSLKRTKDVWLQVVER